MKDNTDGQTHYQIPVEITDREIWAIEQAIRLIKIQSLSEIMENEIEALQQLLDKINKK